MKTRSANIIRKDRRHPSRGLAPLELVLALPIMLFVMALIVNFGNIAAWKTRAQGNTRYAAWRTIQDRTGQFDPHPENWPQDATLGTSGGNAMADVNALWNQHPALTTPVVRGPAIAESGNGRTIIVPGRFDMDQQVHGGDGEVHRRLPLLRGILRNNGRYGFTEHQELLDNRWEYRYLNHPSNPYDRGDVPGDGGNMRRRAKRWYRLDPPLFPELSGDLQRLAQADGQLKANPTRFDLDPLDRDDEFYYYRLRAQLGLISGTIPSPIPEQTRIGIPDFHPRVPIGCELDKQRVKSSGVDPAVQRIQRLPGTMGRAWAQLYQGEIRRLQAMQQQLQMQQPPPQATLQQIQAEIDRLQGLLDQVNRFLASLPMANR